MWLGDTDAFDKLFKALKQGKWYGRGRADKYSGFHFKEVPLQHREACFRGDGEEEVH